jgi:hypothetical protein
MRCAVFGPMKPNAERKLVRPRTLLAADFFGPGCLDTQRFDGQLLPLATGTEPAEKNATPVENKEVVVDDPPGRPMTTFFSRFVWIVT